LKERVKRTSIGAHDPNSAVAEKSNAMIEKEPYDAHVGHIDLTLGLDANDRQFLESTWTAARRKLGGAV
jgi:hypothetical protein